MSFVHLLQKPASLTAAILAACVSLGRYIGPSQYIRQEAQKKTNKNKVLASKTIIIKDSVAVEI